MGDVTETVHQIEAERTTLDDTNPLRQPAILSQTFQSQHSEGIVGPHQIPKTEQRNSAGDGRGHFLTLRLPSFLDALAVSILLIQQSARHKLPSAEDALHQAILLFNRYQHGAVYVMNQEGHEEEHDNEVGFADVLNIHIARNPSDQESQYRTLHYAAEENQPGEARRAQQREDDKVSHGSQKIMANHQVGFATAEAVVAEHGDSTIPLALAEWEERAPRRPLIPAAHEPVQAHNQHGNQNEAGTLMHKAHRAHHPRAFAVCHQHRPVHVEAGKREYEQRKNH